MEMSQEQRGRHHGKERPASSTQGASLTTRTGDASEVGLWYPI